MATEIRQLLSEMRQARRADFEKVGVVTEAQMGQLTDFTYETMMTGKPGEAPAGEGADVRFIFLRYPDHLEEHAVQIDGFLRNRFEIEQSSAQLLLRANDKARGDLFAAMVGLTDADLDVEPVEPAGEWPLREILDHIIYAEEAYTRRARISLEYFRAGEPFVEPTPYTSDADRSNASLADFVDALDAARGKTLALLTEVSDEELRAPSSWAGIDIDLRFLLLRYAMHDREHTAHLRKWRQQVGRPPTEADRLLGLTWQLNGDFEGSLIGANDTILDQDTGDEEWTVREVLAHITRAEHYYTRLIVSSI